MRSDPRPARLAASVVFSEVAVSLSTGAVGPPSGGGGAAAGVGAALGLELHMLLLLLEFVLTPQVFDDFGATDHAVYVASAYPLVKGLLKDAL